jgi:nucleoside 2-deoxyribosyltransferase
VAGPLGFSEAGRHFHDRVLVRAIRRAGCAVIDPWALPGRARIEAVQALGSAAARQRAWRALNREIAAENRRGIDRADALVAVLDGPDVDSGTAAEIGYAFARGKVILGYRGDFRPGGDNEGATVNLQVEHFIRESGGTIVARVRDLVAELGRWRDRASARPGRPRPR